MLLLQALRHPRGRYPALRASHLSGVPERTIYHWAREASFVPDFPHGRPKRWSYRDLIFLRLLARMRAHGIPLPHAAASVQVIRERFATGASSSSIVRLIGKSALLGDEAHDVASGQGVLTQIVDLARPFDLLAPIEGVTVRPSWGPDLIAPTPLTSISPDVLAGEPRIARTRVPTSSLYALARERQLSPSRIVRLFPQLTVAAVEDAIGLERKMRSYDRLAA